MQSVSVSLPLSHCVRTTQVHTQRFPSFIIWKSNLQLSMGWCWLSCWASRRQMSTRCLAPMKSYSQCDSGHRSLTEGPARKQKKHKSERTWRVCCPTESNSATADAQPTRKRRHWRNVRPRMKIQRDHTVERQVIPVWHLHLCLVNLVIFLHKYRRLPERTAHLSTVWAGWHKAAAFFWVSIKMPTYSMSTEPVRQAQSLPPLYSQDIEI